MLTRDTRALLWSLIGNYAIATWFTEDSRLSSKNHHGEPQRAAYGSAEMSIDHQVWKVLIRKVWHTGHYKSWQCNISHYIINYLWNTSCETYLFCTQANCHVVQSAIPLRSFKIQPWTAVSFWRTCKMNPSWKIWNYFSILNIPYSILSLLFLVVTVSNTRWATIGQLNIRLWPFKVWVLENRQRDPCMTMGCHGNTV